MLSLGRQDPGENAVHFKRPKECYTEGDGPCSPWPQNADKEFLSTVQIVGGKWPLSALQFHKLRKDRTCWEVFFWCQLLSLILLPALPASAFQKGIFFSLMS